MLTLPLKDACYNGNFSDQSSSSLCVREDILAKYEALFHLSKQKHEQLKTFLPSGHVANIYSYKPFPVHISHATGPYVYTVEGRKLVDFLNGYSVFIHGHNDPDILGAVEERLDKGCFYGTPTAAQINFCKTLTSRVPNLEQIRIQNSGTEATLFAIRTAKVFTRRTKIVKFFGGYHGTHDSVAVPYNKDPMSEGISPQISEDTLQVEFNDFAALEKTIIQHKDTIAAVIVEPYLGGAGTIAPLNGYLSFMRALTKKYGILLIFDEVVAFRLHHSGAQAYFNVEADLMAYGKFIGGGYPIGVFGGRKDLMCLYDNELAPYKIFHGGTFFGHESALVAGTACLMKLTQESIDKINSLGDYFAFKLRQVIKKKRLHIQVNQIGSILTLHYTRDRVINFTKAQASEKEIARLMHLILLNKGIFTAPMGKYFFISTIMTKDMVDQFCSKYEEALDELYPLVISEFPHLCDEYDRN